MVPRPARRYPFSISLFLGAFLYAAMAHGATVTVCPSCPVRTITDALAKAKPGDEILVRGGTYREGTLVIAKSVTLTGENRPILDGESKHQVVTIAANDVVLRGFQIRASGQSFTKDIAGVRVDEVKRCRIENNEVLDTFFGIYLAKANDCVVTGNTIRGSAKAEAYSGNGIHSWGSEGIHVENNQISGHRDGIYLEFLRQGAILRNVSERNLRYGMHYMYSQDSRYRGNTFRHNGAGVAVMYSGNIEMTGNVFEDNWGSLSYGLLLKDLDDSVISQNVFRNNTIGLFVDGANRLTVERNNVTHNGWGVRLMANTMGILFLRNNFIENTFDVTTNSSVTFNSFLENYWSDYRGYDLDRNGFGDVPHRPVTLFGLLVEQYPELLMLLRSPLVDALNLSERLMPALTPKLLVDAKPNMYRIAWSKSVN